MKLENLTNVYFCCEGNRSRSPTAEKILKVKLAERGISGVNVYSRRSEIVEDMVANPGMTEYMGDVIKLVYGDTDFTRNHAPRAFSLAEVENADIIIPVHNYCVFSLEESLKEAGRKSLMVKVHPFYELLDSPSFDIGDPDYYGIARGDEFDKYLQRAAEVLKDENIKRLPEIRKRSDTDAWEIALRIAPICCFFRIEEAIERLLDLDDLPILRGN